MRPRDRHCLGQKGLSSTNAGEAAFSAFSELALPQPSSASCARRQGWGYISRIIPLVRRTAHPWQRCQAGVTGNSDPSANTIAAPVLRRQ